MPILEAPPELKPERDNAVWIPGYWSWDSECDDFLWVSGVWRVPPPGMRWIAGYWAKVNGGYRWAAGFWTPADVQNIEYYPTPPAPLEQGPSITSPATTDDFWTPGYWTWQENQFVWNRGYWAQARPGWVWVPSSYLWTPRGYLLASGYWDYTLDNRGLLFAPLAANSAVQEAGYAYSPTVAIDPALLSFYLFVRPAYGHYYFGDYFAEKYVALGFYPWYGVHRFPGYSYDPLFAYDRWYYETRDPDWIHNLERWNAYYRQHPESRPPRDLAAEQRIAVQQKNRPDRDFMLIGRPLGTVWQNSLFPIRLARVSMAERSRIMASVRVTRDLEIQRLHMELVSANRTAEPARTGENRPAIADAGPQNAALPHPLRMAAALREPNRSPDPADPTTPSPGALRRQNQVSPFAGAAMPGESLAASPATLREVGKPVLPSGENAGRPGSNSEPPPATIPQPSSQTNSDARDERDNLFPPRRVGPNPGPQLRPTLPPGADQRPGSVMERIGPAPRHPRAPSLEPSGSFHPRTAPGERSMSPS